MKNMTKSVQLNSKYVMSVDTKANEKRQRNHSHSFHQHALRRITHSCIQELKRQLIDARSDSKLIAYKMMEMDMKFAVLMSEQVSTIKYQKDDGDNMYRVASTLERIKKAKDKELVKRSKDGEKRKTIKDEDESKDEDEKDEDGEKVDENAITLLVKFIMPNIRCIRPMFLWSSIVRAMQ